MESAWLVWVILVSIGLILWVLCGRMIILKFIIKDRSDATPYVKDKHKTLRIVANKSLAYRNNYDAPIATDPIPDEILKNYK